MTKIKKRILKIGIIALMPLIALLFTISNTYAWTENGNQLVSSNRTNVQYSGTQNDVVLTIQTDTITINGTYNGSGDLYYYVNLFAESDLIVGLTYTMSLSGGLTSQVVYDTWYNGTRYMCSVNGSMTFTYTEDLKNSGWRFVIQPGTYSYMTGYIMINTGTTSMSYEPYGKHYVDPETYDFNEFLIGQNYFTSGRAAIFQTNDNTYYDRKVYPTNRTCQYQIGESTIGNYLIGKEVNLSMLTSDLLTNLSYETGYQRGRFTHISLKPALALQGTATYPPVQLKDLFFKIYAPGNTVTTVSLWIGSLMELGVDGTDNQRIEFTKQGDYFYIADTGEGLGEQFVWDIDIQLRWDGSTYIGPSGGECLTDNVGNLDRYNLGFETGKRVGVEEGKSLGYDNGFDVGYRGGYQAGLSEGARSTFEDTGMRNLFETILSYPVNLVKNSLDFNFMGINIANVVMFIVSIGIVAFVLKKFL